MGLRGVEVGWGDGGVGLRGVEWGGVGLSGVEVGWGYGGVGLRGVEWDGGRVEVGWG